MDIISKYPSGVIWANLSFKEKEHIKYRYFYGAGSPYRNGVSKESAINCRAQIKRIGAKKTFNPFYGRKFTINIPPIGTFLQTFYGMNYDVHGRSIKVDHKNIKLIVNTENFEELLDFCNYFSNFFYIFYSDSQIKRLTKNQVIRIMRNHRGIYRILPNEFKSDRTIAELALRSMNCSLLAYAPPSILNSDLFFQLAVSKYIDALCYFSEKITHKKDNMKYIESQLYKIKFDKTLNKLPAVLKKKYFENITHYTKCFDSGRSDRKPFRLKTVIDNCNSIESFSAAFSYGSTKNERSLTVLKDLEKIDIDSLPGYKLFFIIALIAENFKDRNSRKFWKYKHHMKYFQFISNIINLKNIDGFTAFGMLSPFQLATFQADLSDSQKDQIEEIKQLRAMNELPWRYDAREPRDEFDEMPF
tara:strand:- start:727 stop:1974 length:1248 start_codon:yes stop_codon:yes gene_type:complete